MWIDIHTHAYRVKSPFVTPFCTLEEILKEQDRLGIDKSVVLPIVSPEIYIPQNTEDIIDMANAYPERIIPFCNVDPRALSNSPFAKLETLALIPLKVCSNIVLVTLSSSTTAIVDVNAEEDSSSSPLTSK